MDPLDLLSHEGSTSFFAFQASQDTAYQEPAVLTMVVLLAVAGQMRAATDQEHGALIR